MKKLATVIAFVSSAAIAAPVFACPNMEHDEAPKTTTAEKDKAPAKDTAKAKDQQKQDQGKSTTDTAKAKDTKDTGKKPDKVSQK
jgi:hypothetical protein